MSSDDAALCEMLNFSGIWNFLLRDCQSYLGQNPAVFSGDSLSG